MSETPAPRQLSLLWPGRASPTETEGALSRQAAADLQVDALAAILALHPHHASQVAASLSALCSDPAAIAYRQRVSRDLCDIPGLAGELEALLPRLAELRYLGDPAWSHETPLRQLLARLGELEALVACATALSAALGAADPPPRSEGLTALNEHVAALRGDPAFAALERELPALRREMEGLRGVSIGVNLDHLLRPVGVTLLGVHHESFEGASLLGRLMGKRHAHQGITPLRAAPESVPGLSDAPQPLLHPLFRDLNEVVMASARPVERALRRYAALEGGALVGLEGELALYLGAARLTRRLNEAGLPTCWPEIAPPAERAGRLQDLYCPLLARQRLDEHGERPFDLVLNDVPFGPEGRVFVLTGPNRGGKTTYTRAVGLAQVLFQAGLPVPARSARMSPVDGIYTHFPATEEPCGEGRLGEEAARLAEVFARATGHSLVLLNESLASTSPGESLYLARDVLRALRLLGARAVYATHLHELASDLAALNRETPGDGVVASLVAGVEAADASENGRVRCTFRIAPGPPLGSSYAREVARRHGIAYEQLAEALRRRGAC